MIRRGGRPVRGFGLGDDVRGPTSGGVMAALVGAGAGVGAAVLAHNLGTTSLGTAAIGMGTTIAVLALIPRARRVGPASAQANLGVGADPAVVRQSVIDAWIPFNTAQLTWVDADGKTQHSPDEGVVPWMYPDILGLITTGMGILIEEGGTSVRVGEGKLSTGGTLTQQGLRAGWKHADGSLASDAEIQAEFASIKADAPRTASLGHRSVQYTLHLDNGVVNENGPSVQALTATKLQGFADTLKSQLPAFNTFCADGQMGLLSHSWAMGASLRGWPKMKAAANLSPPDWRTVAQEDASPTYAPARQASNIRCYLNAEGVDRTGLDPAVLYFPQNVGSGVSVQSVKDAVLAPVIATSAKVYETLAPVIAQSEKVATKSKEIFDEATQPPIANALNTYEWVRTHRTTTAIVAVVVAGGIAYAILRK